MSAINPLHILLVLAAAFFAGARAFRETRPKGTAEDADTAQLQRFAKFAGIGLVLLTIALIVGLNLNMFHAAKAIQ